MINPSFGPLESEAVTPAKETMTLVLPKIESEALEALSKSKDMSKAAVLRQALRLYQMIDIRLCEGMQLAFIDREGNLHRTMFLGLGPHPDPNFYSGPRKACGTCKHQANAPDGPCKTCFSDPTSLRNNKLLNWEAKNV